MSKSLIHYTTQKRRARFRGVGGQKNPVIFLPLAWDPYPSARRAASTEVKITEVLTEVLTYKKSAIRLRIAL